MTLADSNTFVFICEAIVPFPDLIICGCHLFAKLWWLVIANFEILTCDTEGFIKALVKLSLDLCV